MKILKNSTYRKLLDKARDYNWAMCELDLADQEIMELQVKLAKYNRPRDAKGRFTGKTA